MTTLPPSEGPSPEEQAREIIESWVRVHGFTVPAHDDLRERIIAALQAAKRSAHLEDALAAMDEGRRMLRAAGAASQAQRWDVASHRESDAETCGRIADLIRAKVEVWDALSLPPGPK